MTMLLEVCVDTPEALDLAVTNGAQRTELCAALDAGGLTPSAGFMRLARDAPVPVHALIRPRTGGFAYGRAELDVMAADVAAARDAGLAGVVIGASLPDRSLDWASLRVLMAAAGHLVITLHRAFDLVPDPARALDDAVAAGVTRILTSGGAPSVEAGTEAIAALVRQSAGRITIMPGGGVTPGNAAALVRATGATELHASGRAAVAEDPGLAAFGFGAGRQLQPGIVRALADILAG